MVDMDGGVLVFHHGQFCEGWRHHDAILGYDGAICWIFSFLPWFTTDNIGLKYVEVKNKIKNLDHFKLFNTYHMNVRHRRVKHAQFKGFCDSLPLSKCIKTSDFHWSPSIHMQDLMLASEIIWKDLNAQYHPCSFVHL